MNALTFLVSFIAEGMLIVTTGIFLSLNNINLTSLAITSLTAGYLAYRRICFILFSPLSGAIADRVGFIKVFNVSLLFIIAGLMLLLSGMILPGLVLIFTFNCVNSTMAPGAALGKGTDKIRAITVNATWQDMGAAAGTLTGGLLLSGSLLFESFTITTFILTVLLIVQIRNTKRN